MNREWDILSKRKNSKLSVVKNLIALIGPENYLEVKKKFIQHFIRNLQVPEKFRSEDHIQLLSHSCNFIKYFREMQLNPIYQKQNALEKVLQVLQHLYFPIGQTILKEGNCSK